MLRLHASARHWCARRTGPVHAFSCAHFHAGAQGKLSLRALCGLLGLLQVGIHVCACTSEYPIPDWSLQNLTDREKVRGNYRESIGGEDRDPLHSGARKLLSSTSNLLAWVLSPLVICAVGAHLVKFVKLAWYF